MDSKFLPETNIFFETDEIVLNQIFFELWFQHGDDLI